MKCFLVVCFVVAINRFSDAYEYLYDQDDTDLSWLYGNQLYGNGYRNYEFNDDFDDYVPTSYSKPAHYRPIVSYHPRAYYVDDPTPIDHQWNEPIPLYISHETLPRIQKKPVYFAPPTTERPSIDDGYHYPAPEVKYLPPNKEQIPFAPIKKPSGYYYPAPEVKYLPPNKEPVPFAPTKKPDVPKTVYLPPTSVYLPPTKKPTTATPKTTVRTTTRRTTTTTLKPSTPKSLYLPPIVVPEPSVVSEYLPPPRELSHHLQPPPVSPGKPILFT